MIVRMLVMTGLGLTTAGSAIQIWEHAGAIMGLVGPIVSLAAIGIVSWLTLRADDRYVRRHELESCGLRCTAKVADVEGQLDKFERKLDALENARHQHDEALAASLDAKFERLHTALGRLEGRLNGGFNPQK